MDVVVVAHTHWDREWYHTLGRFRQRLVALVDDLLDHPDGAPFLLDGQVVVLHDYLAVRPERRGELSSALRSGQLEAGPWYVLADELIPSGEALVRNLLMGRDELARLGAAPPPVLYCPDAFGHPAALPTLAAGFGFGLIVAWRGVGGRAWPGGDMAWWSSPSGARVLLHHLPPDGYEFGSTLPADAAGAAARWGQIRAALAPRARLGVTLLPSGADHHARQTGLTDATEALQRAAHPDVVHRASLGEFATTLQARAAAHQIPAVHGEMRDSYGYTWSLQGTFASRAHQKRAAARVERALRFDVEPWLAQLPDDGLRPGLDMAWRTLLACHPHDTLCGCSTDDVALAMDDRLRDAESQLAGLRHDALATLLGVDLAAARGNREEWRPSLVVRNAVPRARGGVVDIELLSTIADEPVGPGSADGARLARAQAVRAARSREAPPAVEGLGPVQLLSQRVRRDRIESPRHYPDNDLVLAHRAVAWMPALPPAGIRSFPFAAPPHDETPHGEPADGPSAPAVAEVEGSRIWLRSAAFQVSIGADGRLRLTTADGGYAAAHLLGFESQADRGDLYTPSLRGPVHTVWECVHREIVAAGPLRAAVHLRFSARLPASRHRTAEDIVQRILVRLELDADAPALRVRLRGHNRARDHRLRLVVRTELRSATVTADAAFGPIIRTPIVANPGALAMETPPPTAPLHRHVTLRTPAAGLTLVSDGLAEYEVSEAGDLSVTLVRAVGALSRATLPERPGHAGWPVPTPLAQCRHRFGGMFALAPHPAGTTHDGARTLAERVAEDVLTPPLGETWRATRSCPADVPGPRLDGDGLVASAIRPASGGGIILRCYNVLDTAVSGSWTVPGAQQAWSSRLDESILESLSIGEGAAIPLHLPPRGICTLLVR